MSAAMLTALAAVVLGAAMVGMSLGNALQAHRLNALEARMVALEQDSHTHDILGSKPRHATGGTVHPGGAIVGGVIHPTEFKFEVPKDGPYCVLPVPAASHVSAKQPWDGAGYHR